ncbi:MAG: hypothetical protein WCV92_02795 [Candidatus Buchananbacteria bacterium]
MKKSILLVAIFTLFLAVFAFGSQTMAANSASIKNKLIATSTKEKVSNATSTRCQTITQKAEIKLSNYENGQARRVSAYNNMKTRLLKVVERLTAKGIETADLKADLVMLDAKIKKLSDDYALYISALKQTGNLACGQSDGQFKGKLSEARRLLPQVKKDVLDIRSFYSKTIKPDLLKLKAELKKVNSSSTAPQKLKNNSTTTSTTVDAN